LIAKVKDINFLAARNIRAREKRKTIILIVVLVLVFSAVTLVPYGYLQGRLLQDRQELAQMQSKYRQVKETADQVEELVKKRTASESQVKQLKSLIEGRSTWPKMLKELEMSVPEDVWFISLELKYEGKDKPEEEKTSDNAQKDQESTQQSSGQTEKTENEEVIVVQPPPNQAVIKGKSINLEHIGRFIYKLNGLPYFSKVELQEINRDMGTGSLEFTIMAPLKEGASHAK
jgi:secreted Zn-dependent insulinase-like peptidase